MKNAIVMTKDEIKMHVTQWAHKYNRLAEDLNALRIEADGIESPDKRLELMLNVSSLERRVNATLEKLNGKFDMLCELTDTFGFLDFYTPDYPENYRFRAGNLTAFIDHVTFDWHFSSYSDGEAYLEQLSIYTV